MKSESRALYLDLLKKTLSFSLWPEPPIPVEKPFYNRRPLKRKLISLISHMLKKRGLQLCTTVTYTEQQRSDGQIWPGYADSMIGLKRLDNLQHCIETVIRENVPGDLIETGVWRGGACILMRGVLAAYEDKSRKVFVADSFEGLPKANEEKYPADKGDTHYLFSPVLAVSREDVANNFKRYSLLDDQVIFLQGWFKDTLPSAPIQKLAVMRLDGDMYESTMDALVPLYPKLSPGGYCIIDDYALKGCQRAVDDYRERFKIKAELKKIDWTGRYWRKEELS
jgi:O-methyltransferase